MFEGTKPKTFLFVVIGLIIVGIILFVVLDSLIITVPKNPDSPAKTAQYLLFQMRNAPNTPLFGVPSYSEEGDSVSATTLAQQNNLNANQVCLDVKENLFSYGFEINDNKDLIIYQRKELIEINFYGMCAKKEKLIEYINKPKNGFEVLGFDFLKSGCSDKCPDGKDCCVLFLVKED